MIEKTIEEINEEINKVKENLIKQDKEAFRELKPVLMNLKMSIRFSDEFKKSSPKMYKHTLRNEIEIRLNQLKEVIEKNEETERYITDLRNKLKKLNKEL